MLGLKIDKRSGTVWATSNTANGASLHQYEIQTGKLIRSARLEGTHVFNDVALSSTGVVYVTDTSEGSVHKLNTRNNTFQRLAPKHPFTAANGIALSPDEKTIYVSAFGDGIDG